MFNRSWYDWPLLCGHRSPGIAWVRLCGYGFVVKDTNQWPLLFSQRNRLTFGVGIGKYYFNLLRP